MSCRLPGHCLRFDPRGLPTSKPQTPQPLRSRGAFSRFGRGGALGSSALCVFLFNFLKPYEAETLTLAQPCAVEDP
jgi:hypothetical protein